MELFPLKSALAKPRDSIPALVSEALSIAGVRVRHGDILAVASKVVSISEGRLKILSHVKPSRKALALAASYSLTPEYVQVAMDEADWVVGGVRGALLTVKNGEATANSGVDRKNAPPGSVVLWPLNPDDSADKIRRGLRRIFRKRLSVVIVDSRVAPMRLGTVGFALGSSGIVRARDFRGKPDLYGWKAKVTVHAVVDDLAAAAHLLMSEGREKIPFVLVRNAPVQPGGTKRSLRLPAKDCLFMSQIAPGVRGRGEGLRTG